MVEDFHAQNAEYIEKEDEQVEELHDNGHNLKKRGKQPFQIFHNWPVKSDHQGTIGDGFD